MTSRFGLSGGVLGAVAGVSVGVAAVVGWQFLRPVPPPEGPSSAPPAAGLKAPAAQPAGAPAGTDAAKPGEAAAPPAIAAADVPAAPQAGAAAPQNASADPAATAPPADQPGQTLPQAPRFDTFRLSPDGTAVLAGVAPEAHEVAVLLDGAETARSTPDRAGRFALVLTLPPADQPRLLSLRAFGLEGQAVASADSLVVAPFAVAAVVAAADALAPAEAPAPQSAEIQPLASQNAALQAPGSAATPPGGASEAAAPEAPATLLVSDTGLRKLEAPADGLLAIDTLSYSTTGLVTVAGRGTAGLALRLYLDGRPRHETAVGGDGRWQTDLEGIAPGLYTLRADQLDAAGKVVARAETPFLREPPEALAALQAAGQQAAGAAPVGATALAATPAVQLAASQAPGSPPPAEAAAPAVPAAAQPGVQSSAPTAQPAAIDPAPPQLRMVTVQPGYTLWGIAQSTYGEGLLYVQVFEANRAQIRNPDLIYPGQVFALPNPTD